MSDEPAVWRPNPIVERQIALADQTQRAKSRWAWTLGIVSLGMCPLACLGSCIATEVGTAWLPIALFFVPVVAFGPTLAAYLRTASQAKRQRTVVREEFGEVEGWFVRLSVVQGETASGRDIGAVWFQDGRLYFAGARTSFGLGLDDTEGRTSPGDTLLDGGVQYVLPLRARTEVGALSVAFLPLAEDAADSYPNEERFRRALLDWFAHGERSRGQLPPLGLGSDLPSESLLRVRAVLSTASLPLVVVLLASAILWRDDARFVAALVTTLPLALLALLYPPRRCRRALRDRRRLKLLMRQDRDR